MEVLRPFLLRRLKSDVEKGLPPKKETILKVGMSQMQKQYYKALLQKDLEVVNAGGERKRGHFTWSGGRRWLRPWASEVATTLAGVRWPFPVGTPASCWEKKETLGLSLVWRGEERENTTAAA
ncbi:hypothetical protein VIGAN_UM175400 [Vigna angularis var. angularis]|uniref:SNF2 N-terminal domain-containing protein n=1 Tax=Vigna angularis var. angularis TaxID=157739 RepID=A0A0S3TF94_PHAAN|nr:hypothetical protein VIGAN_UM175400 [Vigna angularis var. angularis]